jgi:hypothetical protein
MTGMTPTEAERTAGVLREKLRKTRASAKKMRERLACQFRQKIVPTPQWHWWLLLVVLIGAVATAGYYYKRGWFVPTSTITKSE